jgi:aminoglycoside phosphotransferase (APT) family kinase protein
MRPLRHSYTNRTLGDGSTVVKRYQGPDARTRSDREHAMLRALQGQLPVPRVLDHTPGHLTMTFVGGVHGQELLTAALAGDVLAACGSMLRRIHQLDPSQFAATIGSARDGRDGLGAGDRRVLVHGDYGPQNVLLSQPTMQITAVLDWEWAHAGDPVEDLAWCEWIIRMHHPGEVSQLGSFFAAYGDPIPPWPDRHGFMVDRCRSMLEFCRRQEPAGPGEALWTDRLTVTLSWHEG